MRKFVLLLVLFAAGCMTATDKECPENKYQFTFDPTTKRDTVWKDTLWLVKKEMVEVPVHDTVKQLVSTYSKDDIFGVWEGVNAGQAITLAFTPSRNMVAVFTGNIGTKAIHANMEALENGLARVVHNGSKMATWTMDVNDGVMTIEEIGDKLFTPRTITLKKR